MPCLFSEVNKKNRNIKKEEHYTQRMKKKNAMCDAFGFIITKIFVSLLKMDKVFTFFGFFKKTLLVGRCCFPSYNV